MEKPVEQSPRSLLTVAEVADKLAISELTVRRMIHRGELRAFRVGQRPLRIDPASLDAYLSLPIDAAAS